MFKPWTSKSLQIMDSNNRLVALVAIENMRKMFKGKFSLDIVDNKEEAFRNARLIEAAPELLVALKAMWTCPQDKSKKTDLKRQEIYKMARLAIEKAEGRDDS